MRQKKCARADDTTADPLLGAEEEGELFEAQWELAQVAWAAEEENARRLATRKALISSIPLAALALSRPLAGPADRVVALMWNGEATSQHLAFAVTGFAGLTVWCLFLVLKKALPIRRTQPNPVRSSCESINPLRYGGDTTELTEDVDRFLSLSRDEARALAVSRLLRSAQSLNAGNERLNQRLQYALENVVQALACFAIACVLYTFLGPTKAATDVRSKQHAIEDSHGSGGGAGGASDAPIDQPPNAPDRRGGDGGHQQARADGVPVPRQGLQHPQAPGLPSRLTESGTVTGG